MAFVTGHYTSKCAPISEEIQIWATPFLLLTSDHYKVHRVFLVDIYLVAGKVVEIFVGHNG
jgi:hypothetical protein